GGTYAEPRLGTEQLSRFTHPGADTSAGSLSTWYKLENSECAVPVLIIANPGGDGANLGADGLPRLVIPFPLKPRASTISPNQNPAPVDAPVVLVEQSWTLGSEDTRTVSVDAAFDET